MENRSMVLLAFVAVLILIGSVNFAVAGSFGGLNITKDITPPVISNVRTMQLCGAGICGPLFVIWDVDEPSYFNKVEYGKGKSYEFSVSQNSYYLNITSVFRPALEVELDKSGNYHYKVTSCDMSRNCATSEGYKIKN